MSVFQQLIEKKTGHVAKIVDGITTQEREKIHSVYTIEMKV
jgi:hypothetical protein